MCANDYRQIADTFLMPPLGPAHAERYFSPEVCVWCMRVVVVVGEQPRPPPPPPRRRVCVRVGGGWVGTAGV